MLLDRISTLAPEGLSLPESLEGLGRLASNIYWTWHPEAKSLFLKINPTLGRFFSPIRILREAENLKELATDKKFVAEVKRVVKEYDDYLADDSKAWYPKEGDPKGVLKDGPVAYFCAEYAFFEDFNQYAGGLGILAGDHCKEASDLGFPFVAVGIFYHRGFFHQMVDWEGRQEHLYPYLSPEECCCRRVCEPGTKKPLTIKIEYPGRTVQAAVWLLAVGRVPVILLDTDLPENSETDRPITSQLYCNGRSMRLHQETVLGVGGVRALDALGIKPKAWHLNEGHSAFLLLERLRAKVKGGTLLKTAQKEIAANSLITIHTPVPEGNERFDAKLAQSLISPILAGTSIKVADMLKLGLGADADPKVFDMTAFALRHTTGANGVSLLHGQTADKTWRKIAGRKVLGVTNGVHMPTWLGPQVRTLLESNGAEFQFGTRIKVKEETGRPAWDSILKADDKQIWEAHKAQKVALLEFVERRLRTQHARHGEGPDELRQFAEWLNPDALLICFARRFAPYKRASLIFSDEKRAAKLLNMKDRPIQVVFTGKAHPSDRTGQDLVSKVYQTTQSDKFRGKAFHLEDYDMEVGRVLVAGADVWLNNPRRPLEASGTSGMKAAANGVVNVSILDGWWDEACLDGVNGFAIGGRKVPGEIKKQDAQDARELYKVLEEKVIPLYFDRDKSGLPKAWIAMMKQSMATSLYSFSTARMIRDYMDDMYSVAASGKK